MARTVEKNRADEIFDEPNSLKRVQSVWDFRTARIIGPRPLLIRRGSEVYEEGMPAEGGVEGRDGATRRRRDTIVGLATRFLDPRHT